MGRTRLASRGVDNQGHGKQDNKKRPKAIE